MCLPRQCHVPAVIPPPPLPVAVSITASTSSGALRKQSPSPQPSAIHHYQHWEPLPHQVDEQRHALHRPALPEVGAEEAGCLHVHPHAPEDCCEVLLEGEASQEGCDLLAAHDGTHGSWLLLGGDLGVQPPDAWLGIRGRPPPRASRELFWVQNAGQREEHHVKCRPSRVCKAAEARRNQ